LSMIETLVNRFNLVAGILCGVVDPRIRYG
jgi:ABC-type dipeptide/oligopeptide/nickel transport system permease component